MSKEKWVFKSGETILDSMEVEEQFKLYSPHKFEVDMLRVLISSDKPLTGRQIAGELNKKPHYVYTVLRRLMKKGMVLSMKAGRLKVYGCSTKGYEYLKGMGKLE